MLKRASVVEGPDFRDAQPSRDENGRPDIRFTLTTEAGDRFYKYTDANKGTGSMAIVLENKVREVATIQTAPSATPAELPAASSARSRRRT